MLLDSNLEYSFMFEFPEFIFITRDGAFGASPTIEITNKRKLHLHFRKEVILLV